MKLLKKTLVCHLVAVVMIVAALAISQSRTHSTTDYQPESASAARRWGEEHSGAYEKFLSDGAGLFSSGALEDMAAEKWRPGLPLRHHFGRGHGQLRLRRYGNGGLQCL